MFFRGVIDDGELKAIEATLLVGFNDDSLILGKARPPEPTSLSSVDAPPGAPTPGIKFQNGFGAWQFQTYFCDFDPDTSKVVGVDVRPGRLPD
jgi:hypothetical protein